MQESLPSWLLCTHLGGVRLRNVGHKSLEVSSGQHQWPPVPHQPVAGQVLGIFFGNCVVLHFFGGSE